MAYITDISNLTEELEMYRDFVEFLFNEEDYCSHETVAQAWLDFEKTQKQYNEK